MKFYIKKRHIVRIISFTVAALLIFWGMVLKENQRTSYLKNQLTNRYQAALSELNSSLDSMAITLEKSLYVGTAGGFSALANEIVLQSGVAWSALASLPGDGNSVSTLSKFLTQVSDYTLYLNRKVVNGDEITAEERKNLQGLLSMAKNLSARLDEANTLYNNKESWEDNIDSIFNGSNQGAEINIAFDEVEKSLSDYPTLIYDGPFSDHIQNKESSLLKSSAEITENEAKKKLTDFLSIKGEIKRTNDEKGNMPSYVFEFDGGRGAVTKRGGYVTYFRKEREVQSAKISYEQAVSKATEHIKKHISNQFTQTYYFTDEGVCTVNFAYIKDGVICYTDLIKVGVAMDTGEIVFYEARGYIMNHHDRHIEEPIYNKEMAQKTINSHLEVKGADMAIIPSKGSEELYCYEFHCIGEDDEEILVYINANTLAEEQLLVLMKTDGGILTK